MTGKEWRTLAIFVGAMVVLAQFAPSAAFALTAVTGLVILLKSPIINGLNTKG